MKISKSENELFSMDFKGKCAINVYMVYRNWSCQVTYPERPSNHSLWMQPQLANSKARI